MHLEFNISAQHLLQFLKLIYRERGVTYTDIDNPLMNAIFPTGF